MVVVRSHALQCKFFALDVRFDDVTFNKGTTVYRCESELFLIPTLVLKTSFSLIKNFSCSLSLSNELNKFLKNFEYGEKKL